MNYFITPIIDPEATLEEFLTVTDDDLDRAEDFFETADVTDKLNFTVQNGVLEFHDGSEIPFTDYKALVAATFTQDGDRYFLTVDGGILNVTSLLAQVREAVEDARSGSKSSAD